MVKEYPANNTSYPFEVLLMFLLTSSLLHHFSINFANFEHIFMLVLLLFLSLFRAFQLTLFTTVPVFVWQCIYVVVVVVAVSTPFTPAKCSSNRVGPLTPSCIQHIHPVYLLLQFSLSFCILLFPQFFAFCSPPLRKSLMFSSFTYRTNCVLLLMFSRLFFFIDKTYNTKEKESEREWETNTRKKSYRCILFPSFQLLSPSNPLSHTSSTALTKQETHKTTIAITERWLRYPLCTATARTMNQTGSIYSSQPPHRQPSHTHTHAYCMIFVGCIDLFVMHALYSTTSQPFFHHHPSHKL